MISINKAATIFRQHTREILRELRKTPSGYRVLAEVDADGKWRGVGWIMPGTISLIARRRQGYAIYFSTRTIRTKEDVEMAIDRWQYEMLTADEGEAQR